MRAPGFGRRELRSNGARINTIKHGILPASYDMKLIKKLAPCKLFIERNMLQE
jgi:hypothetical protein